MAKSKSAGVQSASDIPRISGPANAALTVAGYTRMEQLTQVTEAELLALHGFGRKGLEILRKAMAERGLALAETKKER